MAPPALVLGPTEFESPDRSDFGPRPGRSPAYEFFYLTRTRDPRRAHPGPGGPYRFSKRE